MQALFPLLLIAAMYFLMLRPQQQRARAQREMISALELGDEVVTVGGMIGTITSLTDSQLTLSVAPGVELNFLRGAISQRLLPPAGEESV